MNYYLVLGNEELDRLGVIIHFFNRQIQIGDELTEFTLNNETKIDVKVNEVKKFMNNMNDNGIIMKKKMYCESIIN